MRTIFKYELEVTDLQEVPMVKDAEILTVMVQRDIPCVWAIVDPQKPIASRLIAIVGTGNQCKYNAYGYIGSFQLMEGGFVGHVFDLKEV